MSTDAPGPLLIAYDGSEPAGHAVDEAARLFPGAPALVATVWETIGEAASLGCMRADKRGFRPGSATIAVG